MRNLAFTLGVLFATVGLASWTIAEVPATDPKIDERIQQLDDPEFSVREQASRALSELSPETIPQLAKARDKTKSVEAKERLTAAIKAIELKELARHPFSLAKAIEKITVHQGEKIDVAEVTPHLKRLTEVLSKAIGNEKTLPVDVDSLRSARVGAHVRGSLVVDETLDIAFADDSLIIASKAVEISHARNSIIIGGLGVHVSHAHDCMILAGEIVDVAHDEGSIILSGGRLQLSHGNKSVIGAANELDVSHLRETVIVNTKYEKHLPPFASPIRLLQTDGVDLKIAERPDPLRDKLMLTGLVKGDGDLGFILFKMPGGVGEYVVRAGKQIATPEGKAIPGLEDWRLEFCSYDFAVFQNGDQVSVHRKPKRE